MNAIVALDWGMPDLDVLLLSGTRLSISDF